MEENEQNEELELEEKPNASNKDIWLFLIIIDIVFLCIFAFFLYKNLSAKFLASPTSASEGLPAVEEVAALPETEEVLIEKGTAPTAAPRPTVRPTQLPATPRPTLVPTAQPIDEVSIAATPAEEQKESIWINPKSKGRYKQVRFRYFGEADHVAIISGFTMSKARALSKKKGYWETTLSIAPGEYRFLYIVDGQQILDPYAPQKDKRSLLIVE